MNWDIKQEMRRNELSQRKLAELLGISESTMVIWFRHELSAEKRERILDAIEKYREA